MLNQTNSSQIQSYLMQHGGGEYSQAVDPNSYLTMPRNFTSASKELKETKSSSKNKTVVQPYANEITIAQ